MQLYERLSFYTLAFEQYNEWQNENKQVFAKLKKLIKETAKTPFEGTGKPEALKYEYAGYWSRRITDEHRLVYKVEEAYIRIVSCKFIINNKQFIYYFFRQRLQAIPWQFKYQ